MRIATYNVEWMGNLFDDEGALLADDRWSGRRDVTRIQQIEALGIVFTALDADAVMIIEAPDGHRRRDGVAALETFAAWAGLRARTALMGFVNDTQQEIALLYDPDVLTARHDPVGDGAEVAPRFDGVFEIDLDIDSTLDQVRWSKPPLELSVETHAGLAFRMIGVHAKSKAPHGARGKAAIMRAAIANRRKQLAQCIWLRRRVEQHLEAGEPLIVLGDFNDGPGLDEYEKLFGRSGVEIVIGEGEQIQLYDPNAEMARERRIGVMPASARFWMDHEQRWMQTLLDYVMISPDLRRRARRWRIWHPFDDRQCYDRIELREALLLASDHFPVTLDLEAGP
ncbi:endonuclease/exonuclease/phosphatase family protein [Ovoidimarina sediminis]|uniref:endonuclease/exonuclease/phosphatase family protein n=1 Tax=Ovoidimarina sediminis TaxID=3079856 RepID=UPI0029102321|nr:endonuclease/exonuclease/phosphatase family protein [Rhodophyticola sp. MJ-SS7]MDU8945024.1 endonuclease [Rhodophyticola sp. MJ-SS7]